MKKKTVSLLLVAAMAVGMLAGCGGGKSSISQDGSSDAAEGNEKAEMADAKDVDGTTITFWHSMGGVNGQAIDTLVKKFNDENEYGITVEAQYQGEYDDSLNKLKSAQIGNMGADLVQVYEIGTRFMIESGWTVPTEKLHRWILRLHHLKIPSENMQFPLQIFRLHPAGSVLMKL